MSQNREYKKRGYNKVEPFQQDNKQSKTVDLKRANQVIANTKSFSGGMAFEVSNSAADLSGSATVNVEMSISGTNWEQATDSTGTAFTYTLTSGNAVMESISGIPEGVFLRIVVVENLTGTLEVVTRI